MVIKINKLVIVSLVFILLFFSISGVVLADQLGISLISPETNKNVSFSSVFNVTVNVSCLTGSCGQVNVSLTGPRGATSCKAIYDSGSSVGDGIYFLCPDNNHCFNAYCDMTNGGWGSIFRMDTSLTLTNNQCIFNYANDDMDSYMLWSDLTLRLSNANNDVTNGANYFTWYRNSTAVMTATTLPSIPSGTGANARPVSLPGLNKTIWFDWQNSLIRWDTYSATFASVGIASNGGMNSYGNNYYFISDGISMIHTGYNGGTARLLRFYFNNNTVTGEAATVLSPAGGWWGTEEDTFGHVLFTVNGRVMYYNSAGKFRLAGNLTNPNSLSTDYTVTEWANPAQPGLDFFGMVDTTGYLWFVDWGHDNGGYFNCGNDNYLGVGKTNIMLTDSVITTLNGGGLIRNATGSQPFSTNSSNSRTITLNSGESQLVTWWVNATSNSYVTSDFFSYINLTANTSTKNQTNSWNITVFSTPSITIVYPIEELYFGNISALNYTVTNVPTSSCWYSNNSGIWNSTFQTPGQNFTNVNYSEGLNSFTVYCNNSLGPVGLQGSSLVNFYLDRTFPKVSFVDPTPLNNSGVSGNLFINTSIFDLNFGNITYNWDGTNYSLSPHNISPISLSTGLVSYWHFDESGWNGTMGEVKDVFGRNNGTIGNNANVTSGVHGNAATLDGDSQYIGFGNNPSLNVSSGITVAAWVKCMGTPAFFQDSGIVTKWNYSSSNKFSFRLTQDFSNYFYFYINNGSSTYSVYSGSYATLGQWYFVVGTYNGTDLIMYINGSQGSSTSVVGSINYSSANLYIGQYDDTAYRRRFAGQIDEVMIYNRSLNAAEVSSLYLSRLGVYYDPDRYTFENYSDPNVLVSLENPSGDLANWILTANQSGLTSGQNYTYYVGVKDYSSNYNLTDIRSVKGSITPRFLGITQNPEINALDDLDPDSIVNITATIYDSDNNFDTAIFQWKNSSSSEWNNLTMTNLTELGINTVMNLNFTLPLYLDNITYRIWANDSSGVNNISNTYTIQDYWDCTWNSTSDLGVFADWDKNKHIGNITIYNTGDSNYSNNNCTLDFSFDHNLVEGRIYLNDSMYKGTQYLGLLAKSNLTVEVNATFLAEVDEQSARITVSEISGISSYSSKNTTATIISTTGGPYLYQKIETDIPSYLYLTPQNFSFSSYIRDIAADGTINTTAYNVSFNWSLPSEFLISAGDANMSIENLSNNSLYYNNINISFNETNLGYLSPQVVSLSLSGLGYNSSNDLIIHAGNRTLLTESANITLLCYNISDGFCVSSCSYLQDPDCPEPVSSAGGGGGGGGGGNNGREEKSSATFELLSGKQQVFQLPIENKYSDPKENIRISVSGINSEYIKIDPSNIDRIEGRSSKNITVTITAPAYFSKGEYNLTFVITGNLRTGDTKELLTERKLVTLKIVELPRGETDLLIADSLKIIQEMNSSKLVLANVLGLYEEIRVAYNNLDYVSVKNNYEKIKEIRDSAFSSQQIITELEGKIKQAEIDGISVIETKKLLYTAQSAFARGDYSLALERLSEAKLTFAIETKGEFNLLYVVKNNPIKSGASILGFALFAFTASLVLRLNLYKKKLKTLGEEEKLLLELMKVIQRECFTNNHMSMDEYEQAMFQYESRLSKAIEEKIETEAKIANLMKIRGKKRALEDERKRLVELVKKIQDDYMNKGIIETRIYENMIKSYSARLAEVEEELTFFDAQEALSQNKWSTKLTRLIGLRK